MRVLHRRESSRTALSLPSALSPLHLVSSCSQSSFTLSPTLTQSFILDREERWLQPGDKSPSANTPRWGLYWSPSSMPSHVSACSTDDRWGVAKLPCPNGWFYPQAQDGTTSGSKSPNPFTYPGLNNLLQGLREPWLQRFLQAVFGSWPSYLCHQHRKADAGNQSSPVCLPWDDQAPRWALWDSSSPYRAWHNFQQWQQSWNWRQRGCTQRCIFRTERKAWFYSYIHAKDAGSHKKGWGKPLAPLPFL